MMTSTASTNKAEELGASLTTLLGRLEAQLHELHALMPMRSLGPAHMDTLQQIHLSLSAAEADAQRARATLRAEAAELAELRSLLAAADAITPRLHAARDGIPARPPAEPSRPPLHELAADAPRRRSSTGEAALRAGRPVPSLPLVSEAELLSAPSYMRARLDVGKVNGTLLEVQTCLQQRYALLGATRAQMRAMGEADRKRAAAIREMESATTKALFFFSEDDLKTHPAIRQDATGKNIFAVLRHVGRLREFKHAGMRCWHVR
ncbi:hypothetical protein AB1Y20_001219 [Prymnesium parvum]|uniref:Spindle and kinetochore-associated protein 1 n=1 Tax=Prymnesium parvum TaxID=97485 RepID=A0AB34K722_PRYPA